jgi:hypothetical protein
MNFHEHSINERDAKPALRLRFQTRRAPLYRIEFDCQGRDRVKQGHVKVRAGIVRM